MPILEVEIVTSPEEELSSGFAGQLAASAAKIFGSEPGQTRVKLRSLPRSQYAEDGLDPAEDIFPVFVSVLKRQNPPGQEMALEVGALTRTIGQVCGRPEQNIHVLYELPAAGRLAFRG